MENRISEILINIWNMEDDGMSDCKIDDKLLELGYTAEEIDEANDKYCENF